MSAREPSISPARTTGTNGNESERRCSNVPSPDSERERNESGVAPMLSLSNASAGPRTARSTGETAPSGPSAGGSSAPDAELPSGLNKTRCVCGKWWALRQSECLVLKCKLCKRDIIIRGRDLRVEYR